MDDQSFPDIPLTFHLVTPYSNLYNALRARLYAIYRAADYFHARDGRTGGRGTEVFDHTDHIVGLLALLDKVSHKNECTNAEIAKTTRQLYRFKDWSVSDHIQFLFGELPERSCNLSVVARDYLAMLSAIGRNARCMQHKSLLTFACWQAHNEGRYFVFNTLTVDDESLDVVFSKGSLAFRKYVRSFGPHPYFGVVEKGAEKGRLHIHVLHMLKSLPAGCVDPNFGLPIPKRQIIDGLRGRWPYGLSAPKAMRYSESQDAYAKAGWVWPCVPREGRKKQVRRVADVWSPMPAKGVGAVCGYVTKYVVKAHETPKEDWKWRVKKSHSLGIPLLVNLWKATPTPDLLALIRMGTWPRIQVDQVVVPQHRLKLEMMRQINKRDPILGRTWFRKSRPASTALERQAVEQGSVKLPRKSESQLLKSLQTHTPHNTTTESISNTALFERLAVTVKQVVYDLFGKQIDTCF